MHTKEEEQIERARHREKKSYDKIVNSQQLYLRVLFYFVFMYVSQSFSKSIYGFESQRNNQTLREQHRERENDESNDGKCPMWNWFVFSTLFFCSLSFSHSLSHTRYSSISFKYGLLCCFFLFVYSLVVCFHLCSLIILVASIIDSSV